MKCYTAQTPVPGYGLLNSAINRLPFELHLPGYNFCGPGTKLEKRLARGDQGINLLDNACKQHDIAYSKSQNLDDRHVADKILMRHALSRISSTDASWKEKLAAMGISAAMKSKIKMGMGIENNKFKETPNISQCLPASQKNKNNRVTVKIMEQSITTMKNYLSRMESLVNMMYGDIKKKPKARLPRNIHKKGKKEIKEQKEHIDNYHERKIKEKLLNSKVNIEPPATTNTYRVKTTPLKRKLEQSDVLTSSSKRTKKLDQELEQDISIATSRKRKLDQDDNNIAGDITEPWKKIKTE